MKLLPSSIPFISLVLVISCKKNVNTTATTPSVTTKPLTNITSNSATTGGIILADGNASITQSGIVWSKTTSSPSILDSVIAGTATLGSFTTNLTNLDFNQTYYIRAFATNSIGTGYGDVIKLNTTKDTSVVRFSYNGQQVTYGIIVSPVTGKKWLDRNIGATQAATTFDDYKAYGDLFQWGRPADGHQLINWTTSNDGNAIFGTTTVLATTDAPNHSNFIINAYSNASQWDWRNDNNRNRWATTPQGSCPDGWHVPAISDWLAEISKTTSARGTASSGGITDNRSGYSQLKLTAAGVRTVDGPGSVNIYNIGVAGHYWSTSDQINLDGYTNVLIIEFGPDYVQQWDEPKSSAISVRCIMN